MPSAFVKVVIALLLPANSVTWTQEPPAALDQSNSGGDNAALVMGHPFSAVKYARQVKVLPDGKLQFIRNERYPSRIARDAEGRTMMQMIAADDLSPECDHLGQLVPPICPVWRVFVVDPVARTIAHWPEGEIAGHAAVDFPLSEARLEQTAHATAELPELPPDFSDEDGEVTTADLGDKTIEGVRVHGARWTLQYSKAESSRTMHLTRIHEVWSASDMKLIVRVIDGDPQGVETVWGLEKVSLSPDPALFRPPADYEVQHGKSDEWAHEDFEYVESWFAK